MPFYQVTQKNDCVAIRLSVKNPDKKFYPKWYITGQRDDMVAVTTDLPYGTIGFYLGDGEAQYAGSNITAVPCVILLVNEQKLYVPKQCVRLISEKEIKKALNNEQEQQAT